MTDLRNRIGWLEVYDGPCTESLAGVLGSYFDTHPDRPDDDPITDSGFGEWSEARAYDVLDNLADMLMLPEKEDD